MTTHWTTKPPPGTGVNWAHPLARGLVAAWIFNEGGGLPVAQSCIPVAAPALSVGTLSWENVGGDMGALFAGGTVVNYGDVELVSGQQMSVVMSIRPTNLTQAAGILNKRASAGVNAYSCGFNFVSTNEFCVNLGTVSTGASSGTAYRFSTSGWSTTRYQQIIWTLDGTLGAAAKIHFWRNGIEQSPIFMDVDNGSAIPDIANTIEFGVVNSGSTNRYSGGIAYCYLFNRAFSSKDVQRLYTNPYAFWLPPRSKRGV